jgi:hypothetical protein
MTTSTIPNLSPVGSTPVPWILPRPTPRARLLAVAGFIGQVLTVLAYTTPVTLGLLLGLLVASLFGAGR